MNVAVSSFACASVPIHGFRTIQVRLSIHVRAMPDGKGQYIHIDVCTTTTRYATDNPAGPTRPDEVPSSYCTMCKASSSPALDSNLVGAGA
jgi:hypothetical protein